MGQAAACWHAQNCRYCRSLPGAVPPPPPAGTRGCSLGRVAPSVRERERFQELEVTFEANNTLRSTRPPEGTEW